MGMGISMVGEREWEWEWLYGNGREWESERHSRTSLVLTTLEPVCIILMFNVSKPPYLLLSIVKLTCSSPNNSITSVIFLLFFNLKPHIHLSIPSHSYPVTANSRLLNPSLPNITFVFPVFVLKLLISIPAFHFTICSHRSTSLSANQIRSSAQFVTERVITEPVVNIWNSLPVDTDFSSLPGFIRQVNRMDFLEFRLPVDFNVMSCCSYSRLSFYVQL